MLHSHITYCPIILSITSKSNLNKIFIMQKKAIRTITQSKYNDHTAALFYDEKILPLDYVILQAKLIFMHSIKYKYCPHSFNDVFTYNNVEDFVYELRYPNEFIVPRARIELFKKIPLYTFFFYLKNGTIVMISASIKMLLHLKLYCSKLCLKFLRKKVI
jgi:hypothetical protein